MVLPFLVFLGFAFAGDHYELPVGPTSIAHSHNDYQQSRPLDTAIEQGFRSIEVDVIDRRGQVRVTHIGLWTDGTLKELYLDRLQKLVNERGSVHGDGKKFYIWIEIRWMISTEAIVPMLRELLAQYSMLTVFDPEGNEVKSGPVDLILINHNGLADQYFSGLKTAPACLGLNRLPLSKTARAPFAKWSYHRWNRVFGDAGKHFFSEDDKNRIREFQASAHRVGLRTRFWGNPDTPRFWKEATELPFDVVGTDDLEETMKVLKVK